MRLPSGLAGRIGLLGPEFVRFCVIGSISFGTADAGSNLLRFQAGLGPLSSNASATIPAPAPKDVQSMSSFPDTVGAGAASGTLVDALSPVSPSGRSSRAS